MFIFRCTWKLMVVYFFINFKILDYFPTSLAPKITESDSFLKVLPQTSFRNL